MPTSMFAVSWRSTVLATLLLGLIPFHCYGQKSAAAKRYGPKLTLAVGSPPDMAADRHFHVVLQNESVRVLNLDLAAGDATSLDAHRHDYLIVALEASQFEAVGGTSRFPFQLASGGMQVLTGGWPHKLINTGTVPAHFALIEVVKGFAPTRAVCGLGGRSCSQVRFGKSEGDYSETLLFETETVRLLKDELSPKGALPEHTDHADHLIVALTDLRLGDEFSGIAEQQQSGGAIWRQHRLGSITNVGDQDARMLILELK